MAEKSYLWTTGGAGDGASTYTRVDWLYIAEVIGASRGPGIGTNYFNRFWGSVPGANTFRVATGGAVVDGKPYHNTADVDVNIPSAVGAGNTRIDRIVLRADWTAQTVRIYRIAGTDAADPEPPAYTKTSQSTYDVLLYQVLVDTSGNVSIELDERELGAIITTDIANAAITTEKINNAAVTSAKLQDGAALAEILDDDGAGSNLDADLLDGQHGSYYAPATQGVTNGNSHDHNGGDGAQIPEAGLVTAVQNQLVTNGDSHDHIGGDGATLTSGALQNGAVTSDKLASSAVIAGKIATGGVSASGQIADGIVTSGKLGASSVIAGKIATGGVSASGQIADGIITSTKLGSGAVVAGKIAAGGVSTTGEIADGIITNVKLANLTILSGKIADGAITSDKLASAAVIAGKIGTGGVSSSAQLANGVVTSGKIADGSVIAGKIAAGGVSAANQLATGVVDAAAIASGAVGSSELAADAVIAGKIANGAVDVTACLADNIVDDTKVGNRVPQLYRRQGGSSTDWETPGTTNYTPGPVRIQCGVVNVTIPDAQASASTHVDFPVAFSYPPLVFASMQNPYMETIYCWAEATLNDGCTVGVRRSGSGLGDDTIRVNWFAVGPE